MTTIRIAAAHDGQQIAARAGDTIDLGLAEPAASGFRWRLAGPPAGCTVAGETRMPADPTRPGQPGSHRWRVTVDAAGAHALVFTLGRGWEETHKQRVAIIVTVR